MGRSPCLSEAVSSSVKMRVCLQMNGGDDCTKDHPGLCSYASPFPTVLWLTGRHRTARDSMSEKENSSVGQESGWPQPSPVMTFWVVNMEMKRSGSQR